MVDGDSTGAGSNSTIKSLISVTSVVHVISKDVKHLDHLTENQDTMAITLELGQKLIEKHHLTTARHESAQDLVAASICGDQSILSRREHEGMVAAFLQLHHDIEERRLLSLRPCI